MIMTAEQIVQADGKKKPPFNSALAVEYTMEIVSFRLKYTRDVLACIKTGEIKGEIKGVRSLFQRYL